MSSGPGRKVRQTVTFPSMSRDVIIRFKMVLTKPAHFLWFPPAHGSSTELSVAAAIGKTLLENNIALQTKHEELLSSLPLREQAALGAKVTVNTSTASDYPKAQTTTPTRRLTKSPSNSVSASASFDQDWSFAILQELSMQGHPQLSSKTAKIFSTTASPQSTRPSGLTSSSASPSLPATFSSSPKNQHQAHHSISSRLSISPSPSKQRHINHSASSSSSSLSSVAYSPSHTPSSSQTHLLLGASSSSHRTSPIHLQHTRRVASLSASPQALAFLREQNAELTHQLETLQVETSSADHAGRRKLRKLEQEIQGLRAELDGLEGEVEGLREKNMRLMEMGLDSDGTRRRGDGERHARGGGRDGGWAVRRQARLEREWENSRGAIIVSGSEGEAESDQESAGIRTQTELEDLPTQDTSPRLQSQQYQLGQYQDVTHPSSGSSSLSQTPRPCSPLAHPTTLGPLERFDPLPLSPSAASSSSQTPKPNAVPLPTFSDPELRDPSLATSETPHQSSSPTSLPQPKAGSLLDVNTSPNSTAHLDALTRLLHKVRELELANEEMLRDRRTRDARMEKIIRDGEELRSVYEVIEEECGGADRKESGRFAVTDGSDRSTATPPPTVGQFEELRKKSTPRKSPAAAAVQSDFFSPAKSGGPVAALGPKERLKASSPSPLHARSESRQQPTKENLLPDNTTQDLSHLQRQRSLRDPSSSPSPKPSDLPSLPSHNYLISSNTPSSSQSYVEDPPTTQSFRLHITPSHSSSTFTPSSPLTGDGSPFLIPMSSSHSSSSSMRFGGGSIARRSAASSEEMRQGRRAGAFGVRQGSVGLVGEPVSLGSELRGVRGSGRVDWERDGEEDVKMSRQRDGWDRGEEDDEDGVQGGRLNSDGSELGFDGGDRDDRWELGERTLTLLDEEFGLGEEDEVCQEGEVEMMSDEEGDSFDRDDEDGNDYLQQTQSAHRRDPQSGSLYYRHPNHDLQSVLPSPNIVLESIHSALLSSASTNTCTLSTQSSPNVPRNHAVMDLTQPILPPGSLLTSSRSVDSETYDLLDLAVSVRPVVWADPNSTSSRTDTLQNQQRHMQPGNESQSLTSEITTIPTSPTPPTLLRQMTSRLLSYLDDTAYPSNDLTDDEDEDEGFVDAPAPNDDHDDDDDTSIRPSHVALLSSDRLRTRRRRLKAIFAVHEATRSGEGPKRIREEKKSMRLSERKEMASRRKMERDQKPISSDTKFHSDKKNDNDDDDDDRHETNPVEDSDPPDGTTLLSDPDLDILVYTSAMDQPLSTRCPTRLERWGHHFTRALVELWFVLQVLLIAAVFVREMVKKGRREFRWVSVCVLRFEG